MIIDTSLSNTLRVTEDGVLLVQLELDGCAGEYCRADWREYDLFMFSYEEQNRILHALDISNTNFFK